MTNLNIIDNKIINLNLINNKINEMWLNKFINNKKHIFFKNIDDAKNISNNIVKNLTEVYGVKNNLTNNKLNCDLNSELNKIIYPKIKIIKDKKQIYNKYLTNNDIKKFMNIINKCHTKEYIENEIEKIKNKLLPSNIKINSYLNSIKKNNKNKILIIGGGPNGLFNALYLNYLYKNNIDILILDNRCKIESYREPYTRERIFNYSTDLLTILYKYLYCNDNNYGSQIKYIEYLGYFQILNKNVPIYFTKKYENWNNIQKFMKKYNFKIIFDCTGNRLNVPKLKINNNILNYYDKSNNKNYKLNLKNNEIILQSKNINDTLMNIFTISFYDKNKNYVGYNDCYTNNKCDIILYKYLNNKLISKKTLINDILPLIINKLDKKIIYEISIEDYLYYFKFNLIKIDMHHKIIISNIFKYNNYNFLYIGNGDTIFHSHFITGSGLNRLFTFIVKILYLINIYFN